MLVSKKTRHEPHEEHADESWLLPYADLLTLLLALFLVLYAMSATDAKKFQEMSEAFNVVFTGGTGILDYSKTEPSPDPSNLEDFKAAPAAMSENKRREELKRQEQEDLERLKQQLDNYIKANGLSTELSTKLNQSQLVITIRDNALFASGEAVVKPEARELAVAIAQMLDKFPGYGITVAGHTDNVPISNSKYPSNWDLSADRALQFMKILLENSSLDPKQFMPTGYGEYHPIADNATVEGRARNRRVEVSIIRKYQDNPTFTGIGEEVETEEEGN